MYNNLIYRRQFLLTKSSLPFFSEWKCLQIDNYFLYIHPDLEVDSVQDPKKIIIILGSIFDPNKPEDDNATILNSIHEGSNSAEDLFKRIKRYAGSYVLIYKDAEHYIIFNDPLGIRQIYYSTQENQVVSGSQPNLLAKFADPQIGPTSDHDLMDFYNNHFKNCSWIGDETYFEGIKHLLPNRYLDLNQRKVSRYWPCEPIRRVDLEEAVSSISNFLQGVIKAITYRHPTMMAVTSGLDSRTTLAASRDIKDKIYFFINDEGMGSNHPDIAVPERIFKHIGLPFHVHNVSEDVDDAFRQIFLDNVFISSERILPSIYNVYFKNHSEKVNISGSGEMGRTRFGKEPRRLNSHYLAYKMGYHKSPYALRQCEQILADIVPVARRAGINVMDLFQWEQYQGNKWVVAKAEHAISIDEIDIFDSHLLYEYFWGVDDKYTDYKNPIIFREIIRHMWPELLNWPINPPYTIKEKIKKYLLINTGLFEPLKHLRYKLSYLNLSSTVVGF